MGKNHYHQQQIEDKSPETGKLDPVGVEIGTEMKGDNTKTGTEDVMVTEKKIIKEGKIEMATESPVLLQQQLPMMMTNPAISSLLHPKKGRLTSRRWKDRGKQINVLIHMNRKSQKGSDCTRK